MDIATGLGPGRSACVVLVTLILMGGDLRMFLDMHAFIVIFGGATRRDPDPLSARRRSSTACRSA